MLLGAQSLWASWQHDPDILISDERAQPWLSDPLSNNFLKLTHQLSLSSSGEERECLGRRGAEGKWSKSGFLRSRSWDRTWVQTIYVRNDPTPQWTGKLRPRRDGNQYGASESKWLLGAPELLWRVHLKAAPPSQRGFEVFSTNPSHHRKRAAPGGKDFQ